MKRILMGFILCVLPMVAGATDMCARDDIMVMVFDPQVAGTNNGSNAAEWSWWAAFPYGRIAGEATCLSKTEGLGRTATQGAYYGTGTYASTFITADSGLSGTDDAGEERKYCWCKMTHPAVSRWVFSTRTVPHPFARPLVRSFAAPTSAPAPPCGWACSGLSAFDVSSYQKLV